MGTSLGCDMLGAIILSPRTFSIGVFERRSNCQEKVLRFVIEINIYFLSVFVLRAAQGIKGFSMF